jgi:hypothetical protein
VAAVTRPARQREARRRLRRNTVVDATGMPESGPAVAERTASTRAAGGRPESKAADLRSGKARGWDGDSAKSERRVEVRLSATAEAAAAWWFEKWADSGSVGLVGAAGAGEGAAAVVPRERHGSRTEVPPRRRGGRMAAAGEEERV